MALTQSNISAINDQQHFFNKAQNKMDKNTVKKKIIDDFELLNELLNIAFYEIILIKDEQPRLIHEKLFNDKFSRLPLDKIKEQNDFISANEKSAAIIKLKSGETEIICAAYPIISRDNIIGYVITQSFKEPDTSSIKFITYFTNVISTFQDIFNDKPDIIDKHTENLIDMRSMQARLFPKFDNIEGIDVASVYLPVELMTGNFIDAFFLNENIYQIVACTICGSDASSSFTGAAIRTLVRSFSTAKTVPSSLLQLIIEKLEKMIAETRKLTSITVFQIDKNGKTRISSYGEITTIYYNNKNKKNINLNKTTIGKNFAKRNSYKDITFSLEPSDILFYYSGGTVNASTSDGKLLYGEDRLIENIATNIESSSLDIVHSVTESIYEFINYSQIEDDILLLSLKKLNSNS